MFQRFQNHYCAFTDYIFPAEIKNHPTEAGSFHLQKILEYGTDLRYTEVPEDQKSQSYREHRVAHKYGYYIKWS